MCSSFTYAELEAYLDEMLPPARMTAIEEALPGDERLRSLLAEINGRRDAGVHTIGEIWRRHRLSCPTREQLGSYLLGVLSEDVASYVTFHLETIQCRYCTASAEDLRAQQSADAEQDSKHRRQKYFQSSAGYLSRDA